MKRRVIIRRTKPRKSFVYRVPTCRACEVAVVRQYQTGAKETRGKPDREDWHKQRKPWPWPPGTPVFNY